MADAPEQNDTGRFAIGEIAERAGVPPSTIRYYERIDLLPEPRRIAGRRRYGEDVLRWMEIIALARRMGLSLAETRVLIWGFPSATPPVERWGELARSKLDELDEQIGRLQEMRTLLHQALACDCSSLGDCVAQRPPVAARSGGPAPSDGGPCN